MDLFNTYQQVRGVNSLYAWQRECLEDERLTKGRENFVLWLPTGAGKTLVAELLMIRECLKRSRNCLFILPYVAIVQEKVISLAPFEEKLAIIVEEYAASKGRFPPIRRRANSIYLCTIEKANGLVNSLIENGRADELGLVIVDELVGMSATLGNAAELCRFLGANLFRTHFRPVTLVERIKMHDKLYRVDEQGEWRLEKELESGNKDLERRDPDGLFKLLGNLVKGSVLIFCPTKQSCENVCQMLSNFSPKQLRDHRAEDRNTLIGRLMDEHDGLVCPVLNACIRNGVAYHHSGLSSDERQLVEGAYKSGIISVICCTSTLAAGVNLPARRVIIRSPHVGREQLKKAQYLQMIGRAGRAGLDEKGDSIVILHHGKEAQTFKKMHEGLVESCVSGLTDQMQLEGFFLDLIVLKLCSSLDDIYRFVGRSLFGVQHPDETELLSFVERTVQSLLSKKMDIFAATQIGSAAFNANLNPQMALDMCSDLGANLGQGIVLISHFHLLYNCVSLDVEVQVDWNLFYNEYLGLSSEERQLIHSMGLSEATLIRHIHSHNQQKNASKGMRVYVVFMLRKIWNQKPLWEVARHFGVPRGWLQSVLQSAVCQSSSIVRFAERMPDLWALRSLLPQMVRRLSECTRHELIPLLSIECVKLGRARQLYEKGFRTVGSIAKAEPRQLIEALGGKLSCWQCRRMISSAKAIIRDQIAEKAMELEELGAEGMFSFPSTTVNCPTERQNYESPANTPASDDSDPDNIDPVYLALKQATEKYGTPAESRRGSQNVVMVDSPTPSPRDLSQTSLQDSGTYSGSGDVCGSRQPLVAGGSTPHLHGIFAGKGLVIGNGGKANEPSNGANNCQPSSGRRPKLSEKMKSLSLDCAEMPDPVQSGMMRPQYTRRFAVSSGQQSFDKSASPHGRPQAAPTSIKPSPKRLPPVPAQHQQQHSQRQQAVVVQPSHQQQQQQQQQQQHNNNIMHIIIHDYSSGECVLHPGNRVVVVDNGDPDWKHGFKLNDCLEQLLTFPSSCVAAYHMEEQPMQLLQSCNLVEQKIRLYRDQIVFAQPNGLSGEGRMLLVRNEHNKFAHCPLQFLTLA
uniref:Helicase POLQ-like n=1 Tax=Globodera pallida TaxID=36090 RepID=A0A183BID3_GLOPA